MASASVLEFICCSWISSWRRSCSAFWQILLYAVVHLVLLGAVAGTGDQLDRQEFLAANSERVRFSGDLIRESADGF